MMPPNAHAVYNCVNGETLAKVKQETVKMTKNSEEHTKCEWQMTFSIGPWFMTVTEMVIKICQSGEKYIPFLSHTESNDEQEKAHHRLWIVPNKLRLTGTGTKQWRLTQNLQGMSSHSHFCFYRGTLGTQIPLIADMRDHKDFRHEKPILTHKDIIKTCFW